MKHFQVNKIALLVIVLFISNNLSAQEQNDFEFLKGKWVKAAGKRDTLEFKTSEYFLLKLEHGSTPPRDPEGMYFYSFKNSGIILQWAFASTVKPGEPADYFHLDKAHNILIIGNFYKAHNSGSQLIFKKLK